MKVNTNIVHQFIKRKDSVVKYSAFIILSTVIVAILIHANVEAGTNQGVLSRQQIAQSSLQKLQEERRKSEKDNGFFPITHAVTATSVPTPTPTPAIANRSAVVSTDTTNTTTPVPTPTPTPISNAPVGGGGDVTAIINQVFGANAPQALKVARCESGLNPAARNPNAIAGSFPAGLFQILYPSTWSTTPEAGLSPYDATANVQAAYAIFVRDGYSWREWSCA